MPTPRHVTIRRHRPKSQPLRTQDIRKTSRATAAVFKAHDLPCCLFGSAACSMYGLSRVPNDVDMIVFSNELTQEELKFMLVKSDPNFFLVKSRRRGARYTILFYTLPSSRFCKVDILIPGVLSIPNISKSHIEFTRVPDVPVMPIIAVMILKLQGWLHHRNSSREDFQEKQWMDIQDIMAMLNIWATKCYREKKLWKERWMPVKFVEAGHSMVEQFLEECPDTLLHWKAMGFTIPEVLPILGAYKLPGSTTESDIEDIED